MTFPIKCMNLETNEICKYVYYYGIEKCQECIHYGKHKDNFKLKDKPNV